MLKHTRISDPELYRMVEGDLNRQIHNIEMIASESTVPLEVLELNGSVFTNKSLEGYPGGRYQAGSEFADQMETLACQRAKELYALSTSICRPTPAPLQTTLFTPLCWTSATRFWPWIWTREVI